METTERGATADRFDKILQRAFAEEAGEPEPRPGLCQLPLVPRSVRLLPALHRRLSKVERPLLDLFERLVTGAAPWPLLLHGAPGSGKTCAAVALADIARTAAYLTVEDLCDAVMGRRADADPWGAIEGKNLIVLDELGCRQKVGDLEYTAVKRVLDIRETQHGRLLVAISNVSPESLVQLYDRRIGSRLTCGTVYELTGPDRRRER